MVNATFTISLAACVGWLIVLLFSRETKRPPGPRRLLFLGNTLQIPSTLQWLTFSKWAKEYGQILQLVRFLSNLLHIKSDIVYLEVFGQPLVLLNTHKAAKDLLEQRSLIYSDRPRLEMADLCGFDKTFVLYSAHDNWRQQRKIVTQDLGPRMLPRYHAFQEAEARLLAKNVIDDPGQLEGLVKRRVGTIIIRIAYGHYVSGNDDPFLTLGKVSMDIFSRASASGVWLVDLIPARNEISSIMASPEPALLLRLRTGERSSTKQLWDPYIWSKHLYESGSVLLPNTCSTALEAVNGTLPRDLEEQVVWATCTMMAGGMDTVCRFPSFNLT
ncbi:putative monooxygenase [Mycena sanguinolenta]|uniref:Putative monooxygenase n=1 Tax=Mycena sanguinolenta TaxID=230812 RepID=A0A8H7DGE9_9AGAR|nr:putative monooxygenase [Mycena sanguinolenta]